MLPRKGLQWKSFFGEGARAKRAPILQKRLQRKARPDRGNGVLSQDKTEGPREGYAQMSGILEFFLRIFVVLQNIGVDWFRQQDQWVSKHAENRSAISLIPCYTILTGDQEFALAA